MNKQVDFSASSDQHLQKQADQQVTKLQYCPTLQSHKVRLYTCCLLYLGSLFWWLSVISVSIRRQKELSFRQIPNRTGRPTVVFFCTLCLQSFTRSPCSTIITLQSRGRSWCCSLVRVMADWAHSKCNRLHTPSACMPHLRTLERQVWVWKAGTELLWNGEGSTRFREAINLAGSPTFIESHSKLRTTKNSCYWRENIASFRA